MAITTHAELKTAVSNWLRRSDLSSYLDDLVTLAETRIFREVRSPDMEATYVEAIDATTGRTTAPDDFLGWRNVSVSNGRNNIPLTVTSPNEALQSMDFPSRTGVPNKIWMSGNGTTFSYAPFPDSNYTVSGTYIKKPGTLATAVYALFTNNPDLFLFASLAEAAPFLKDDKRVELWEAKYQNIRDQVNKQYERTRFGGPLQMVARGA